MNRLQIESDARSVAHLADYLEELQAAALSAIASGEIQKRGYITPSEEETFRRLQISYWQSRNALFEMVQPYRHGQRRPAEAGPQEFLVAFAAALLLVDAARFLREHFHEITPIRHKLDEPDEQFGVPANMYATVQKSLTSPLHAWHLYHALQYFDAHADELHAAAQTPLLRPVMAVIDRLDHRLRLTKRSYFKTRAKVRGRRVAHRLGRDVLGRALYGLQKAVASMMADVFVAPGHAPSIPEPRRTELIEHLTPGDVLVVRKEYAVTNYFLPGYWPHAALYLGDADALRALGLADHEHVRPRWSQLDPGTSSTSSAPRHSPDERPRYVLEAMKDGVRIRSIDSPLASDSLVVLRPQIEPADLAQALARGLSHEGKAYDFDFDFNRSDRLVCTEVVYRAYEGIGDVQFELTRRAGRNTLSAGDLIQMAIEGRQLHPVVVYSPKHSPDLLTGDAARQVLKQEHRDD